MISGSRGALRKCAQRHALAPLGAQGFAMLLRSLRASTARAHVAVAWPRTTMAQRLPSAAAAAAAAAGGLALACAQMPADAAAPIGANRVLGDGRHRVAVTQFTLLSQLGKPSGVSSFGSFDELCRWVAAAGYDGLEIGTDDVRRSFLPNASYPELVSHIREATARHGTPCLGVLYHITDHPGGFASTVKGGTPGGNNNIGPQDMDLNDAGFWQTLRERLRYDAECGCEYVTFQINLPPQYLNTGGMYRDDDAYLRRVAQDIARLQAACFEQGMNFYVETHMDRLTEDLGAFCKIMDYCPVYFEVNADISHYNFRQITKGAWLDKICDRVGHTHQRMARQLGDLSAEVPDPASDWDNKGLTWEAFESMRRAFKGGLSSRTIVGESGPIHLVKSALETDASLMPLYRFMCEHADREAGLAPSARSAAPRGAPSAPIGVMSEAEAEAVLRQHFGAPKAALPAPSGAMSPEEAEAVLRQHFGARA
eukprot:COSAG06_NODE_4969_length_3822_cov_2.028464_2_plen_482_part_00